MTKKLPQHPIRKRLKRASFRQLVNRPFQPKQWYIALELDIVEVRHMTIDRKKGFVLLGYEVDQITGKRLGRFSWRIPANEISDYTFDWTFVSDPLEAE